MSLGKQVNLGRKRLLQKEMLSNTAKERRRRQKHHQNGETRKRILIF